jgi:sugar/nucleoside kinase (ribokinase family)
MPTNTCSPKVVISAGIVTADVVVRQFAGLPELGSLAVVDRIELYSGGSAANTAITLVKLGVPTELVACTGDDAFAEFLVGTLTRSGVNTRGLVRLPDVSTAATVVFVAANGERSFLHAVGASAGLRPDHFPTALLDRCRILHIGGALLLPAFDGKPMADVLQAARTAGAATSLDTVWDSSGKWYTSLAPCLPQLDVLMTSEREAIAIAGSSNPDVAADFFLSCGVRWVAIKRGERGCLLASANERHHLQAITVSVVDTTGAGDAFAAGFLAGLADGQDLTNCGLLGRAAGALCVTDPGAANFPVSMAGLRSMNQSH